MFSIEGKHVFITGGAHGIGRAVAERFIAGGARVCITDIADGTRVASELGASFLRVDVGSEESVGTGLNAAAARFGSRLDVVINNAGIGDIGFTLEETPAELLQRMTAINQWGVLYGLKHGPAVMNDGGSIINTASLAAQINMPGSGLYSAAKAAVVSMTRMSALELGCRGIRVNAVCPAYVGTAMGGGDEGRKLSENLTALGRPATTDDLVGVFHFLAADESRYLTGQALVIDGGWSCGPTPAVLQRIIDSATVG